MDLGGRVAVVTGGAPGSNVRSSTGCCLTAPERAAVPPLVPAGETAGIVLDLARDDSAAGRIIVRFADEAGPRALRDDTRD